MTTDYKSRARELLRAYDSRFETDDLSLASIIAAEMLKVRHETYGRLLDKQDELSRRLSEAVDHIESVLSSDPQMPSHARTMAEADAFVDEVRIMLEKMP